MSAIRQFLLRIRQQGVCRTECVKVAAMGRLRTFLAYDVGCDTFIFEKGVSLHLSERPSVLIVDKASLRRRARGCVMTLATGNHAVAALPLLDGRFWKLSSVPAAGRGGVLTQAILCANVVGGVIEISQRDVSLARLAAADRWLRETVGFAMGDVVMGERNEATLEHFRRIGQEWRVKPLAWTETEMRTALAAARKRMGTKISYYHSARGVHLLAFPEFARFAQTAESDPQAFLAGLRELVSVDAGNSCSFTRMPKYRGHHEIEFFGLRRGVALESFVPQLERLMEAVELGRTGQLGVIQRAQELVALFASLLSSPEFADETSRQFTETLYMYITGEIYAVVGEGSTPAFDDRRTALPGATFLRGRPLLHPGTDARTEVLLSNLRGMMSKDELIEYANVYELRADESAAPLGCGATREVVYKTNRRPLENSLVEKRLSHSSAGYSDYLLARIGGLRSLGISLSDYYLLLRRPAARGQRPTDYYIRHRCKGEPMSSIPLTYFRAEGGEGEDAETVLALATLMGDAAAQNLAMKKYDPKTDSPIFGVGKEIYEFEYDIRRARTVPMRVATCSVRGSFGWPCQDCTEENLSAAFGFYFGHYAAALAAYGHAHPSVGASALADRFMEGFAFRTRTMAWHLAVMRDRFEAFNPDVPRRFAFAKKWRFALWSIERQAERLSDLRGLLRRNASLP